ncbi:hypothetical protein C8Q76DRAFT_690301 [Earliella scabrosa]|nr:hypothetical protein C8Q76DRAFT_690301 [Earliella scabrosa]
MFVSRIFHRTTHGPRLATPAHATIHPYPSHPNDPSSQPVTPLAALRWRKLPVLRVVWPCTPRLTRTSKVGTAPWTSRRNKSRTQQLRGRRWFEFRTLQQPARLTAADPLPLPSSPCSPGRAFSAQIELDVNGTSRIPASSAPVAGGRARPAYRAAHASGAPHMHSSSPDRGSLGSPYGQLQHPDMWLSGNATPFGEPCPRAIVATTCLRHYSRRDKDGGGINKGHGQAGGRSYVMIAFVFDSNSDKHVRSRRGARWGWRTGTRLLGGKHWPNRRTHMRLLHNALNGGAAACVYAARMNRWLELIPRTINSYGFREMSAAMSSFPSLLLSGDERVVDEATDLPPVTSSALVAALMLPARSQGLGFRAAHVAFGLKGRITSETYWDSLARADNGEQAHMTLIRRTKPLGVGGRKDRLGCSDDHRTPKIHSDVASAFAQGWRPYCQ